MSWKLESELCDDFARAAAADGFEVFPEVANWDLVLVRDGAQVGVQAKLRANFDVLVQAIAGASPRRAGPAHRAVLVPRSSPAFRAVARALRLGVYDHRHVSDHERVSASRRGVYKMRRGAILVPADRWEHKKPLWLPPVAHGSGGVQSPRPLTRWRVQAIKLCLRLEERGYVTTADFKDLGIPAATWRDRWVRRDGSEGRLARYVAVEGAELPIEGFREIAALL